MSIQNSYLDCSRETRNISGVQGSEFKNSYRDEKRAASYARLQFPNTYYLAFRDLPDMIRRYVSGKGALDLGCGAGRSSRFLKGLGFNVIGIDISKSMIDQARSIDPDGDYRIVADGDLSLLKNDRFDLVLSAFTFDNIPGMDHKVHLFAQLADMVNEDGMIINLVSSTDLYVNEWVSFSTLGFPENRSARSGDIVRVIIKDVEDERPVEDIFWSDEDYQVVYKEAGLETVEIHRPLAEHHEPFDWINETRISPWRIYVIRKSERE